MRSGFAERLPLAPRSCRRFLRDEIFSVPQLEVLLLVQGADGDALGAEDLARAFHLPASTFDPWLVAFAGRGLVVVDEGRYRALPAEHPQSALLDDVAEAYARRRVSVTRQIYEAQEDPARRLADAFRLRKDEPRTAPPSRTRSAP